MSPLTTLIVDDEPLARTHLRSLLAEDPEISVVGECGNGRDAVEAIARRRPQLVLLDIQMPELDGLGVIEEVGPERMPHVVFVTAYDEYAVKAFEANAIDYLMKPVTRPRLHKAVARAKNLIANARTGEMREPLTELLERMRETGGTSARRLAIKRDGRVVFLRVDEIDWLEAADDHVVIHAGRETHRQRDTLTRLEQRLPSSKFLRVHRSAIVNVERIREIQPWFQGDYVLILADGTKITTGRSYRERVRGFVQASS